MSISIFKQKVHSWAHRKGITPPSLLQLQVQLMKKDNKVQQIHHNKPKIPSNKLQETLTK